jgi:hypothetical protein
MRRRSAYIEETALNIPNDLYASWDMSKKSMPGINAMRVRDFVNGIDLYNMRHDSGYGMDVDQHGNEACAVRIRRNLKGVYDSNWATSKVPLRLINEGHSLTFWFKYVPGKNDNTQTHIIGFCKNVHDSKSSKYYLKYMPQKDIFRIMYFKKGKWSGQDVDLKMSAGNYNYGFIGFDESKIMVGVNNKSVEIFHEGINEVVEPALSIGMPNGIAWRGSICNIMLWNRVLSVDEFSEVKNLC